MTPERVTAEVVEQVRPMAPDREDPNIYGSSEGKRWGMSDELRTAAEAVLSNAAPECSGDGITAIHISHLANLRDALNAPSTTPPAMTVEELAAKIEMADGDYEWNARPGRDHYYMWLAAHLHPFLAPRTVNVDREAVKDIVDEAIMDSQESDNHGIISCRATDAIMALFEGGAK